VWRAGPGLARPPRHSEGWVRTEALRQLRWGGCYGACVRGVAFYLCGFKKRDGGAHGRAFVSARSERTSPGLSVQAGGLRKFMAARPQPKAVLMGLGGHVSFFDDRRIYSFNQPISLFGALVGPYST